ncbi:MAG: gamma carbonic anhydrase family protein [Hahellaceae bacterium]|nr:gamma carbonic anhydrase family protein [Hahellaceae bacterium]
MPIRSFKGTTPQLASSTFIDPSAIILGDVQLGENSSVWPMAVIRGDMHTIRIGQRTSIQDGAVLHITHASPFNPEGYPLTIGDDVTVGHKAVLHGCTLENRILIGMNAVVMDGAHIQSEVILAAGSLVPPGKILESGFLYVGNPARRARALTEQEIAFFTYVAGNYVKLKNEHLAEDWTR